MPVRTALQLTEDALLAALTPVVPLFDGSPAVFWRQAPSGAAAALTRGTLDGLIVCQSQDGGGQATYTIGQEGWSGPITVRCIAPTPAAARALLNSIPEPLALTIPGYAVRCDWQRPLDIPDAHGLATAAGLYRIHITPT